MSFNNSVMSEARVGTSTQYFENVTFDDVITPWNVESRGNYGINYDRLIERFKTTRVDNKLLFQFERVTGKIPHYLLRRGIFFCHRDIHKILDLYQQGQSFYLYMGISPSSDGMHLGHLVPFTFCKWLQETFDVPLIIQLSDDERVIWNKENVDYIIEPVYETVKDIIACGFNPHKTFIFSNLEHIAINPAFYLNTIKIQKYMTISQMKGIFGFDDSDSVGKIAFPATRCAPTLSGTFPFIFKDKKVPCVIPCAINQDPYFRGMRDVAPKLQYPKPALLHSIFLPALYGPKIKMSSSDYNTAIFLRDNINDIESKINEYSFKGVYTTNEENREFQENFETDVSYQWLKFFMENDKILREIKRGYTSGAIFARDLKDTLINVLKTIISDHQAAKNHITTDLVKQFTTPRDLGFFINSQIAKH